MMRISKTWICYRNRRQVNRTLNCHSKLLPDKFEENLMAFDFALKSYEY